MAFKIANPFAASPAEQLARLEKREADAKAALNAAEQVWREAIVVAESGESPEKDRGPVDRAKVIVVAARERCEEAAIVLADERVKQAAADAAADAGRREREAKKAAAIKATAFKQAAATAAHLEQRMRDVVEAAREALDAQRALQPYMPYEFSGQMVTATYAIHRCLEWHMRGTKGGAGPGRGIENPDHALWTHYVPSTIWPQ